jgi:uncharacterized damage-inducible protein DinB
MPSEAQFLAGQLKLICDGGAWYGDSVFEILHGITAEQALARPIQKAHSIWEIVLHMTAWGRVDMLRMQGQVAKEPPEGNFPKPGTSEAEWQIALKTLREVILGLSEAASKLSPEDLDRKLARGGDNTYRENLHGAVMHIVYHSAQIAVLKKEFA